MVWGFELLVLVEGKWRFPPIKTTELQSTTSGEAETMVVKRGPPEIPCGSTVGFRFPENGAGPNFRDAGPVQARPGSEEELNQKRIVEEEGRSGRNPPAGGLTRPKSGGFIHPKCGILCSSKSEMDGQPVFWRLGGGREHLSSILIAIGLDPWTFTFGKQRDFPLDPQKRSTLFAEGLHIRWNLTGGVVVLTIWTYLF